jgi:hypothetical protein
MRIGRPLLVGVAFLAFIWRRGFTFLKPLPRSFNFLADFVVIILMLLLVGTSPPLPRGRLLGTLGRPCDAQPGPGGTRAMPPGSLLAIGG